MQILSKIASILPKQPETYIIVFGWIVFITYMIGVWHFQHYMMEFVLAQYNFTATTIVCFMVILTLLPYSLSKKLKLPICWYALIFLPSIIISTLLAQETLSNYITIIAAIVSFVIFVGIAVRKPKLKCDIVVSNLLIGITLLIYAMAFSNTDELTHYKYDINYFLKNEQYKKALQIGKNSLSIDSTIFNLRIKAMLYNNSIGDDLFHYPIPLTTRSIATTNDSTDNYDIALCNLLLKKDLKKFVSRLQKHYDIYSHKLPQHYKEALMLYMLKTIQTSIDYEDESVETNYQEFKTEMKKHKSPRIRKNLCRDLYGDTYFWYYYFFPLKAN